MGQKIRLKLRAFDHRLLDSAAQAIINTLNRTGAKVKGPIPLPRVVERFTVIRSPHVDKTSREQFEIRNHMRMLEIEEPNPQAVEGLMKLDLSAGVDVEIKLLKGNAV